VNTFQDLEHALLAGVVLATLRGKGLEVTALHNEVDDSTPYFKLTIDRDVEAIIVVLPRE
jgi:hypothetical protein